MSFGEGIASMVQRVEEKHGSFAAWCAFISILGSALLTGVLVACLATEHTDLDD
jgi:hypothetical protein